MSNRQLGGGTFELTVSIHDQRHLAIKYSQPVLILEAISLQKVHSRKSYCSQTSVHQHHDTLFTKVFTIIALAMLLFQQARLYPNFRIYLCCGRYL